MNNLSIFILSVASVPFHLLSPHYLYPLYSTLYILPYIFWICLPRLSYCTLYLFICLPSLSFYFLHLTPAFLSLSSFLLLFFIPASFYLQSLWPVSWISLTSFSYPTCVLPSLLLTFACIFSSVSHLFIFILFHRSLPFSHPPYFVIRNYRNLKLCGEVPVKFIHHKEFCLDGAFEETVQRDFRPPVFSSFKSTWATDQMVKIFSILVNISLSDVLENILLPGVSTLGETDFRIRWSRVQVGSIYEKNWRLIKSRLSL